jgi:hypothetical protein
MMSHDSILSIPFAPCLPFFQLGTLGGSIINHLYAGN